MFRFSSRILAAALFLFAGALAADTIYVISPAAKLLTEPKMSAREAGLKLDPGQPLEAVGQQGMFYQVKAPGGTAYVARIFVSPYPPQSQQVSAADIRRKDGVAVTKQASDYTETAAARGLSAGGGGEGDIGPQYEESQVRWIEAQAQSERQVDLFLRQGGLNRL